MGSELLEIRFTNGDRENHTGVKKWTLDINAKIPVMLIEELPNIYGTKTTIVMLQNVNSIDILDASDQKSSDLVDIDPIDGLKSIEESFILEPLVV